LCDENPGQCAFSGDAAERYVDLAASLRTAPVEIQLPDGTIISFLYQDLISNTLGAMYDSFSWPDFALFLADPGPWPHQPNWACDWMLSDGPVSSRSATLSMSILRKASGVACSDRITRITMAPGGMQLNI
jgi:hypothetical protein